MSLICHPEWSVSGVEGSLTISAFVAHGNGQRYWKARPQLLRHFRYGAALNMTGQRRSGR